MRRKDGMLLIFIIFMVFGIMVALQFKSTQNIKKLAALNTLSLETVKTQLDQAQRETEELRFAIDEELAMQNEIIMDYLEKQDDAQLASSWEKIKLHTGLVDVKGPGITIKLDDAPARQPDTPVNWQIIHDQDIKVILNDLKKAGAQAIAINGERVVPMSEQLCAGPTIMINDNRYSVPYYIEAIGEPEVLYNAIVNSSRIAEMTEFNIRVDIKMVKEIKLSKFSGADNLDRYLSGLEVADK